MRVLVVGCLMLLAACGSATAPARGPLHFSVLSGDHQTGIAGRKVLMTKPVTGQVYRKADGSLAFRILDAALPAKAFAQSVVQANGVPGEETCWADVPGHPHIIPFSVCVNTQANGLVSYTTYNDTIAGEAQGEIHVDSAGHPLVTAVITATIIAGDVYPSYKYGPGPERSLPAVVSDSSVKDRYGNPIPFRIVDPTGQLVVSDTAFGTAGGRTIVSGLDAQSSPNGIGYTVELHSATGTLLGHCRYEISARLNLLVSWTCAGTDNPTP